MRLKRLLTATRKYFARISDFQVNEACLLQVTSRCDYTREWDQIRIIQAGIWYPAIHFSEYHLLVLQRS